MRHAFQLAFILSAGAASVCLAQTSIDDIIAGIDGRAGDIARAEALLADGDRTRRIAAMEALLDSGDPVYVQAAKEAGLTSSDPTMRAAAVKAVLDAGGTFVAEFAIPAEDKDLTPIYEWLKRADQSWSGDRRAGFYSFGVGPFDETQNCWLFIGYNTCALFLSGEKVVTGYWRYNNMLGHSVMSADETGALVGSFLVEGAGTPVAIRIPLLN